MIVTPDEDVLVLGTETTTAGGQTEREDPGGRGGATGRRGGVAQGPLTEGGGAGHGREIVAKETCQSPGIGVVTGQGPEIGVAAGQGPEIGVATGQSPEIGVATGQGPKIGVATGTGVMTCQDESQGMTVTQKPFPC